MSIHLQVLPYLRDFTNGREVVEVEGKTVGDCLQSLINQFPDIEKVLFERKGKLAKIFEIYVNKESTYPDELNKSVGKDDEIYIVYAIAGG